MYKFVFFFLSRAWNWPGSNARQTLEHMSFLRTINERSIFIIVQLMVVFQVYTDFDRVFLVSRYRSTKKVSKISLQ